MKPIIKIVFTKLRGYENLNTNLSLGNGVEFHNQYKSLKVIDCAGCKTVYQPCYIIHSQTDIIPKMPSREPWEDAHSNQLCCCQVHLPVTLTLISLKKSLT